MIDLFSYSDFPYVAVLVHQRVTMFKERETMIQPLVRNTGWWLGHPSEKYESHLGWLETQYYWENKKCSKHFQTTNQNMDSFLDTKNKHIGP